MIALTITTGHSGTQYLTRVLEGAPRAYVVHEAGWTKPDGDEVTDPPQQVVIPYQREGRNDLPAWYDQVRVPNMARLLQEHDHYIEASQLLGMSDMPALLELLSAEGLGPVKLVHLHRDAYSTAFSLLRNGCVPGLHDWGGWGWPWAKDNKLRWREGTQRIVRLVPLAATTWLWFEVAARAAALEQLVPVRSQSLSALNEVGGVEELCTWLGVAPPSRGHLARVVGRRVNAKARLAAREARRVGHGVEKFLVPPTTEESASALTVLADALEPEGQALLGDLADLYHDLLTPPGGIPPAPGAKDSGRARPGQRFGYPQARKSKTKTKTKTKTKRKAARRARRR